MKKIITLTDEQSQALYGILNTMKLDLVANRVRSKTLDILEDTVVEYEEKLKKVTERMRASKDEKGNIMPEALERGNEEIKNLSKVKREFVFNDRELFVKAKDLFEKAGAGDVLEGHRGRMYYQIEDAFLDVKEVE